MPGETSGLLGDGDSWNTLTGPRSPSARASGSTRCRWPRRSTRSPTAASWSRPSLVKGRATTTPAPRSAPTPPSAARSSVPKAARQTAEMMELVTTQDVGTAPGAGIAGYRVAGKTGTAQQVGEDCSCYDGALDGLLRRLRPGRQAPLHRLRRDQAPRRRCERWWHRRPGVPQDPLLRAPEVRRAADRHQAAEHPHRCGAATASAGWITSDGASAGSGARPHPSRRTTRTPLSQVVAWTGAELRPADQGAVEVTGLSLSSQRVRPGDLYAALPGSRAHGATYAADAVAAGAVAVLTDAEGAVDRRGRDARCWCSSTRGQCSGGSPRSSTATRRSTSP